jgi:protein subunit release factor B
VNKFKTVDGPRVVDRIQKEWDMEDKTKELIFSVTKKDLDITYFSGSGGGGQHRNKHKNCVRMRHAESGAMTTGQDHKSRTQNQKDAFTKLGKHLLFVQWCKFRIMEKTMPVAKPILERVEEMMKDIKIEFFDPDKEESDGKSV